MKICKLLRRAAAFALAAVTALSAVPATTAFAAGDIGTISFTHTYDGAGNAIRYNSSANIGGHTAGGTGEYKYRMYVDGETAFCLQPGVPLKTGNTLAKASSNAWNSLSAEQKKAVGLALLYGYQGNSGNLSGSDDEKWLASQTYRYLINNANFESYIKIVKKDVETGKVIPYAGAGFQIYDPNGELVTMTFTYPEVTEIDTFYTTADGGLITPQTLEYGKGYSLVEVQAPYGYVLDSEPVYFDVEQENSEEESGVTIVKVERSNMAQKGEITVAKSGEVFSRVSGNKGLYQPIFAVDNLEGAVYEIKAGWGGNCQYSFPACCGMRHSFCRIPSVVFRRFV